MRRIKFDCNSNNAPAYSCNQPGDNSGEYVSAAELEMSLKVGIDAIKSNGEDITDFEAGMLEALDSILANIGA